MLNLSASPTSEHRPPPFAKAHQVLLVDDHALCRMGMKALLVDSADSDAIDWLEASSLHEAMQLHAENPAVSLVLLDLNMSDCKGLQGLSQILASHPEAKVVILSGTQDEFVVRQARAMGAAGYLLKGSAPAATRDALLELVAGDGARPASAQRSAHFPKSPTVSRYDRVAELGAAPPRDPRARAVRLHQPGDQQLDQALARHGQELRLDRSCLRSTSSRART